MNARDESERERGKEGNAHAPLCVPARFRAAVTALVRPREKHFPLIGSLPRCRQIAIARRQIRRDDSLASRSKTSSILAAPCPLRKRDSPLAWTVSRDMDGETRAIRKSLELFRTFFRDKNTRLNVQPYLEYSLRKHNLDSTI